MKKKKFVLTFPPEKVDQPLTYTLVKEYDIKVNILKADISAGEEGNLLVELEGTYPNLKASVQYINSLGVNITPLTKKIEYKHKECINCGSCTAVCFPGALTMKKPDWQLNFDTNKCVVCELCIKACPLELFKIDFGGSAYV